MLKSSILNVWLKNNKILNQKFKFEILLDLVLACFNALYKIIITYIYYDISILRKLLFILSILNLKNSILKWILVLYRDVHM